MQQELVILEPLLDRGGACPRRKADLALEVVDGLLEVAGGRLRLVRLCLHQDFEGVVICEPSPDAAVDDKDEDNQPDKSNDIFAEQAPWAEPIRARSQAQGS